MQDAALVALQSHQDELCRQGASHEQINEKLKDLVNDELEAFGKDLSADMAEVDEYQEWQDLPTDKPFDELNFHEVACEARLSYRLRSALVKKLEDLYEEKATELVQKELDAPLYD